MNSVILWYEYQYLSHLIQERKSEVASEFIFNFDYIEKVFVLEFNVLLFFLHLTVL